MSNEEKQPAKKRQRRQRGHGEGSIYYREDKKQWVAQISLENGKTKQRYRNTRSEAAKALQEMLDEQQKGILANGPRQTVGQYLEYWLEIHQATLKLSTQALYRRHLDNHILPGLGHYQLQSLTTDQVQAFYSKMLKERLSARTLRLLHAILSTAFKDAVRWKRLSYNVCDAVKLPRLNPYEGQVLDQKQARRLLAAAKGSPIESLLTLALVTGMRLGEMLALRWSDISFEEKTLQVCHTVDLIQGHGYVETEPKTKSSRRTIALPLIATDALKQHRATQLAARLQAGADWKEQGLVFTNEHGGYLGRTLIHKLFKKLLQEAGLPPMRLHDMRHSAATILLSMGIPANVVQEILGHANISMTLGIYGHVLPSMQRDAMDDMDNFFRGKQ